MKEEYVNKTHPIARMQSREEELSLSALKLIDIYLARINPNDPEHIEVKIPLAEYCEILNIEKDKNAAKHKTRRFMSRYNSFAVPVKSGWKFIALFSACWYQDGCVTLKCTEDATEFIFDLAKYGYIRYKLKYILRLRSRHAYNLYIYILDNRFRGHWTIDVDELRKNVYHVDVEYYEAFKYFKRDILDKSIEEVNELTDAQVSYTVNKSGRKIVSITFTAKVAETKEENGVLTAPSEPVLNLIEPDEEPDELDEEPVQLSFDDPDDDPVMCFSDAVDDEFTRTELEAIRFRLCDIIQDPGNFKDRWDFLKKTWQKVKIIAEKRPIADTHAYLLAILDQEVDNRRI